MTPVSTLTPEAKRALLAERLRQKAERSEAAPLSLAQERLWFLDKLNPESPLYNIPVALHLRGVLNVDLLRSALNRIVQRHQILRTRFVEKDGEPQQVVQDCGSFPLPLIDLSHLPAERVSEELEEQLQHEASKAFNLETDLMMRATLYKLAPEAHVLLANFHHIAADEWSLRLFFSELSQLYRAQAAGADENLPELPIQYSDFAVWQRRQLNSEESKRQFDYWKAKLGKGVPQLELPSDFLRPPVQTYRGAVCSMPLSEELGIRLRELSRAQGVTVFMTLLAAFKVLMARYTQQEEIAIGAPIAGRNSLETERLIGFFVNTLVLHTDLSGEPSFTELLRRVQQTCLEAFANQDIPFDKLVEKLQPERSSSTSPFVQVLFALENEVAAGLDFGGLSSEVSPIHTNTAKFDLTFVVKQSAQSWMLFAEYNTDLFRPESMARLLRHFSELLASIAANPSTTIGKLSMMPEDERRLLLEQWNQTTTPYPRDGTVHKLLEEQVDKRPNARAITFGQEQITYGELNERANQLGWHLRNSGAVPGMMIGICMDRGIEMIVALLAILKAGCAYVPLDPTYPQERIRFMLDDSEVRIVLAQSGSLPLLTPNADDKRKLICVDQEKTLGKERKDNLPSQIDGTAVAYVIYTSGSTGKPKGVCVPHRAILRLVCNTDYVKLTEGDRVAQASNASFDAATFEIWGALLNGAQVIGIPKDVALDPREFAAQLERHQITTLFLTTALFNQLVREVPHAFRRLRHLLFGGEAVDPHWPRELLRGERPERLLHVYGPTETTTFASWHLIEEVPAQAKTIPIGKPIANTQIYILNKWRQPVPIGVPGELFIGGDGLAKGYLNRPELTAERFVPNPFCANTNLYRTGDIGRFLSDGSIEFVGRVDNQVKLRGFRVELGEIEAALAQHPNVREAVVLARQDGGERRLVAYYTLKNEETKVSTLELRQHLSVLLPDYMVPTAFVLMDVFPLNPNGKINRHVLPAPCIVRPEGSEDYRAPRDPLESKLAAIWQELLSVPQLGIDDNFFDLGGHSLLAVRLFSRIEQELGEKLPLSTLFKAPTIERLAAEIRKNQTPEERYSLLVDIQPEGNRPPIFWIHSLGGDGGGGFFYYRKLAELLGRNQPSFGVRSPQEPFTDIESMAAHYIEQIRIRQPRGPYYLGGFCFGGVVAYEMARQLQAQHQEIGLVILLESAPPNLRKTAGSLDISTLGTLCQNLRFWITDLAQQPPRVVLQRLTRKAKAILYRLGVTRPQGGGEPEKVDIRDVMDMSNYPKDYVRYAEAHWEALNAYSPGPYPGKVVLFRGPKQPVMNLDRTLGWSQLALGGVDLHIMPGNHEKMLQEPNVHQLARALDACITTATGESIRDEADCHAAVI